MTGDPDRRAVAVAGHTGDGAIARAGLDAADPAVRATALQALARLDLLTEDALAMATADADPTVRRRAATLAAGRPDVELTALLSDPDPRVAETAAWACGERASPRSAEFAGLLALATGQGVGDDPLVREAAVAALGSLGDDRGLDAILRATHDKPAIRRRAVLALAPFVDPDHERASDVADALSTAAADRDWQVRQAAEDIAPAQDDSDDRYSV